MGIYAGDGRKSINTGDDIFAQDIYRSWCSQHGIKENQKNYVMLWGLWRIAFSIGYQSGNRQQYPEMERFIEEEEERSK
jgi:hypothetical protein